MKITFLISSLYFQKRLAELCLFSNSIREVSVDVVKEKLEVSTDKAKAVIDVHIGKPCGVHIPKVTMNKYDVAAIRWDWLYRDLIAISERPILVTVSEESITLNITYK